MSRRQYTAATVADWTLASVTGAVDAVPAKAAAAASWSIGTVVAASIGVAIVVASAATTAAVLVASGSDATKPAAPPASPPYPPPVPLEMQLQPVSFGALRSCRIWHDTSGDLLQQPDTEPYVVQNVQGEAFLSVQHDLVHAEPPSMVFVGPTETEWRCEDSMLSSGTSVFRAIAIRPDSPSDTHATSLSTLAAAISVRGGLSHADAARVLC